MLHTVLNEATVPSGEFGEFQTEGNPPGSVYFTNHGRVMSKVAIYGSADGVGWEKIGKIKAKPGATSEKKLKILPRFMNFHNCWAASGPADLTVNMAE